MEIVPEKMALSAHLFNLFGLLWLVFFIKGLCQMIFAGAFARYYWTWNKRNSVPEFLILTSVYTTLRYHMGSVALGSFLLATVNFIRCIIEYIDRKCRQYPNNELVRAITCMFRCCFWCLDKFLRFLNTNAYIMVAIYGKGFFSSAKDAFSLLLDNIVRVVVIDQVADYLLFMGKLSVTSLVGLASYYVFNGYVLVDKVGPYLPHVTYTWVPVLAIIIGTYLIASSFFSVYDMAVDTIFLCFCKIFYF
jgi:choline transporter-like protein 2/4/5